MSATCHRCGAFDHAGNLFRSERLPFRGARIFCPKCHAKLEENYLLGMLALNVVFGVIGFVTLWSNPASTVGHVFVNVFLVQFVILPSVVIHEFAHALVAKLCGLTVLKIWIGRGKPICRLNLFGFDTEFKMVPVGGLTFLTHGFKNRLRFRYFLAVFAGPLINAVILAVAWKFTSWRNFSFESSIQFAAFVAFAQIFILVENLLPYRIQTALGRLSTDGLSLFQLLLSKSPDVLNSHLRYSIDTQQQTYTP
jgi:hypothetical protein